jgi:histidinol-phosphate aminotransferase
MREILKIIKPYDAGIFSEGEVINLSSNENPYEPSEEVKRAYLSALTKINRYPDAGYPKLKKAISDYLCVEQDRISVGCGSSELISRVFDALIDDLDRVVVPMPSYSLYLLYAFLRDASVLTPIFKNYELDEGFFDDLNAKLTVVCSPNNPTGNTVKRKILEKIAENSEYLVIDEAYVEFSDESHIDFALELDNVIILRSFSKFFGLAGLRVGYAISSKEIASAIEKIRLPFAISVPAVEAAISAIRSIEYYEDLKKKIIAERERMFVELKKMGFEVLPSKANFLLTKTAGRDIADYLAKRGILVRKLENLLGLEGLYLRITIGKKDENDTLLATLRSYCCESAT